MPYKKGECGNPKGRPKVGESIAEIIRQRTKGGQILVDKAFELLESENEGVRVDVIKFLTERGWGKAAQPIEHSGGTTNRMVLVFPVDGNGK